MTVLSEEQLAAARQHKVDVAWLAAIAAGLSDGAWRLLENDETPGPHSIPGSDALMLHDPRPAIELRRVGAIHLDVTMYEVTARGRALLAFRRASQPTTPEPSR